MAIELVTGKAGVPHVDSEDVGAFNARSLGSGAYIMSGCKVTAKSANSVNIAAGEILWEGRHIRVKGSGENLAVDNGQTGYNRRDLVTLNYAKGSNGIESVSFAVVKGTATTGTAADPSVKVGSILAGDTSAVIPFARITLSGLSVATPTVLLGSLPSLVSLRDSVSQSKDYVVEQGVKSDWQYVKWASGRAECSRSMEVNITKTGNYWLPEINLPFAFKKTANSRSRFSIFVSGGDYNAPVLYPKYPVSESTVSKVCCAVTYATENGTTTVNYLVRGWWK